MPSTSRTDSISGIGFLAAAVIGATVIGAVGRRFPRRRVARSPHGNASARRAGHLQDLPPLPCRVFQPRVPHRLASLAIPTAALLLLLGLGAQRGFAQQSPDAEPNSVQLAVTTERTIYIPFSKLQDVFEKEGRGIFLPYDQFEAMWKAAQKQAPQATSNSSPVDSIISAIANNARVEQDVVRVEATLNIELLKQGWNRIPLRLANAAILSAEIAGRPARIIASEESGYDLVVNNSSMGPKRIELHLVYARAFEKQAGKNSVWFDAPQSPVNRWRISIAQAGIQFGVTPMLASAEDTQIQPQERPLHAAPGSASDSDSDSDSDSQAAENGQEGELDDESENSKSENSELTVDGLATRGDIREESVLLAFVGPTPRVTIEWTPKAEGASGLPPLIAVHAIQQSYLSTNALRTRATLEYEISRAPISELSVEVPLNQKVMSLYAPNLRQWNVEPLEGKQVITIQLFEPAVNEQQLTLEMEHYLQPAGMSIQAAQPQAAAGIIPFTIPLIRAIDAGRQQGVLVLQVDPTLRIEPNAQTGLQQIDAEDLPDSLGQQAWQLAYRYASLPFDLQLLAQPIEPRITVHELVEYRITPNRLSADVTALLDIEQAGLYRLEFSLPPDFEIQNVAGVELPGAVAAQVDSFRLSEETPERLIVSLARKAIGRVGITFRLQRSISDPNLVTPTGAATNFSLRVPQFVNVFATRASGSLVITSDESLRLTPSPTGLRSIGLEDAFLDIHARSSSSSLSGQPKLAYQFSDSTAAIDLSVERRQPYVTTRQRLLVEVEDGVAKFEALFLSTIQYSGVEELRIDVPSEVSSKIRNVSSELRDRTISPPPEDIAPGYTAWMFSGDTELRGDVAIKLQWGAQIEDLKIGQRVELDVPRLVAQGSDRAWGQILITKSETLDVTTYGDPSGLRAIDPGQDSMPDAQVANASRAFEFHDVWSLRLAAVRYKLEEVKRTSIERGLVRVVATRSGRHSVHGLYRIRSARQRLALRLPKGVEFDSQPVRIDGAPANLERADTDLLTIPLTGQDPNQSFVLDLRYNLAGNLSQVALPFFPEEPAIQKVYLGVYLPEEYCLLRTLGPWTDEFTWRFTRLQAKPWPTTPEEELVQWIGKGLAIPPGPEFQRDGTLYLFSALSPAESPAGDLHLTTTHRNTLSLTILGLLLAMGFLLLGTQLGVKLAVVFTLLAAAVACGICAPPLGHQLLSLPTIAGLSIVGVAWLTWHARRLFKRSYWHPMTRLSSALSKHTESEKAAVTTDSSNSADDPSLPSDVVAVKENKNPAPLDAPKEEEGGTNA